VTSTDSFSVIPGGVPIVERILVLCEDSKVIVKRAALSLLVAIFKLNNQWMTASVLQVRGKSTIISIMKCHSYAFLDLDIALMTNLLFQNWVRFCRDKSLQVRKEMIASVTDLMLHFPDHHQLTYLWVDEIPRQVVDREIRVQDQALNVRMGVMVDTRHQK